MKNLVVEIEILIPCKLSLRQNYEQINRKSKKDIQFLQPGLGKDTSTEFAVKGHTDDFCLELNPIDSSLAEPEEEQES